MAGSAGGPARAQVPFAYEYAVKVMCGGLAARADSPLAGGRYFTAVNVHNPGNRVDLRRKVAASLVVREFQCVAALRRDDVANGFPVLLARHGCPELLKAGSHPLELGA